MFRSWKLGRAFGIPLFIHPTFLLVIPWVLFQSQGHGLFAGLLAVAVVLTVFGCVILHELGHALMARYFGITTRDITLYPIGGVARLNRMSEKPHEELCIALAGPAVNVVIAALLTPIIALALMGGVAFGEPDAALLSQGVLAVLAQFLFWVWGGNIVLVVFNMIPAFPMDGGRVLRALLSGWLGQVRATDIACRLGFVLAILLAVWAVHESNPLLFVVSLFVPFLGQQERLAVRYREAQRQAHLGYAQTHPWSAAARDADDPWHESPRTATPPPTSRGFSGIAWDGNYRVWVRWVDGRPVAYYAPAE